MEQERAHSQRPIIEASNMRPSRHSHNVHEDVPIYGPSPTTTATSAQPYLSFPTSIQHDNPAIDHISHFDHRALNHTSEEHHASNAQSHFHNHDFQVDPNSSPIGRQEPPIASPTEQQQHEFVSERHTQLQSPNSQRMPNATPPGQFDMLPPPPTTHQSWQLLHDFAQSHASTHGYALSINTTAKNRSRIKLACVCYGAPKNTHKLTPETRVRKNRVSYKTGCKMWIEGKKQEDGLWVLRVGEPHHNHPGRSVEGWAVQRKRTWGVQGGRVGVGGVTAKEEQEKQDNITNPVDEEHVGNDAESPNHARKASHSLESGGLVWRIVEQEMLRKGGPGQGRDRGVGRTVRVLEERLPGIHIFKRDVYNIRAQIKRARKAAGQQIGEGLDDSDNEEVPHDIEDHPRLDGTLQHDERDDTSNGHERGYSEIDPTLVAQCNDALRNVHEQQESEMDRLRREVDELRRTLAERTKEIEQKNSENEGLRAQVELANMALYNARHGPG